MLCSGKTDIDAEYLKQFEENLKLRIEFAKTKEWACRKRCVGRGERSGGLFASAGFFVCVWKISDKKAETAFFKKAWLRLVFIIVNF